MYSFFHNKRGKFKFKEVKKISLIAEQDLKWINGLNDFSFVLQIVDCDCCIDKVVIDFISSLKKLAKQPINVKKNERRVKIKYLHLIMYDIC